MIIKSSSKSKTIDLEIAYSKIKAPVISEKSTTLLQYNQYVFDVKKDATKPEIKSAIEAIFKVKVKAVNTLNRPGKEKKFRGHIGHTKCFKRAIVHLTEGQTIDIGGEL